jgi:uncharacterized OB-fold protein
MTTTDQSEIPVPMPEPDAITQFFWDGVKDHKLLIQRCNTCGRYIHWPREFCRFCLSKDLAPVPVSGRGTVVTYTLPSQPFHPWFLDKMPYVVAVVELPEQEHLQLVTNIVDCPLDELRIDMPVEVVFREVAPGLTLPQFRPAGKAGQ